MKLRTLINIILMAFIIWLFPALINNLFNLTAEPFEECTSAVIGRWAVADGRALLWKNRDTEVADNKIVFLNEGPLQALALVNADSLASVWMGVNEAGFAIINTASEDLEGSSSSQNGSFQKKALLNCRTVEEFEVLLQQTNKSGRATKANYGVIDATGAAAYFETGNHTYARFDVGSSGFLVRTNFAFTGDGTGTGKFRYDRAFQLISEGIASQAISPEFILRQVARDLVNDVLNPYPLPYPYGQDGLPAGFIRTVNSINRYRTRSAVVFQGVRPGEEPKLTTMWVMLGEPVCTIGLPLWLMAENVPHELNGLGSAPLCDLALLKKEKCYPLTAKPEYLNTTTLNDGRGGGLFAYTFPLEDWIFQRTKEVLTLWRQQKPNGSQVRSFQTELASLAYACFLVGSKPNDELPAPQNLSCQLIMNRSLFMKEWGHYLSWERPPVSLELAQYRIYEISRGERKLIVDLPATQLSYFRRNIDPNKSLVYAVVAIDKQGKESNPAVVKVLVPWLISQIESFFPVFIH